jgi:hypothetical protein
MQPQYAYQTAPMNMMPTFEGGGRVKGTYGLRNAAEMLRRQGRGDDTVLAHINPQEAGILKLMGGSGTINPYTGLPEYRKWYKDVQKAFKSTPIVGDIYKGVSSIGKEVERGVESIAKDKILGPIAQMASYLHPVSAALYAGLAPEGSSFDTKGAAKAAVMQQIAQGVKEYAMGTPAGTPMDGSTIATGADPFMSAPDVNAFGLSDYATQQAIDNAAGFVGDPTYYPSVEAAVSSAGSAPFATGPEVVDAGITPPIERGVGVTQIPASGGVGAEGASMSNLPYTPPTPDMSGFEGGINERGGSYKPDYNLPPVVDRSTPLTDYSGVRGLDPAGENFLGAAGSLAEGAYDLAVSNPKTAATAAYMGYTAYQTKKELDAQKAEAERVLADQANRTKEEIEFAQSVLRDYPYNYQRLTEEDIRRERGMAMGGRINSYDDEPGMDDGMMQGGIAALAKGGLPPRYLRGGGDGMSDSIRARIGGKQEARLADGEFVVPADVVSHLGNGSSNAGAKRLYEMMNRVRKSRTGKTRQAPEVNTRKMMPV